MTKYREIIRLASLNLSHVADFMSCHQTALMSCL